ncbi:MAG: hypothetical protein H6705_05225 [Myxococcales bacterium]|nr:hypothetical protein [Myxococcales bacterium]
MHAMMRLALAALVMAAVGCGVLVDDGYVPDPPDARPGSASDGGGDGDVDGGDAGPEAWWEAIEHDPSECPEEAARRRAMAGCDPSCDGVSHFDCRNGSSDPCCACIGSDDPRDGEEPEDGPGAPPGDDSPGGPAGGGPPPGGSGGGGGLPRPSPSPRASAADGALPCSGRG